MRSCIEARIAHYRVNLEDWVIVLFRRIPAEPTAGSVEALNEWIGRFLPKNMVREMAAEVNQRPPGGRSVEDHPTENRP